MNDIAFEPFIKLIHVIQNDYAIYERIIEMLQLEPFQRRSVLNHWLDALHRQNAPEHLRQALSFLFDDAVADGFLSYLNNRKSTLNS